MRLVLATRAPAEFQLYDLEGVIEIGASSRATLGLAAAARAIALIHGRNYVLPQDVAGVARDVMAHRLVLTFDAVADDVDSRQIVDRIVNTIAPPQAVWNNSSKPEFR